MATVPLLAAGLGTLAVALPRARFALLAIGLALAGSWLGALRLEAIDRTPMSAEIGRAAVARVTVTGPARRTQFALRVPGRIDRFGDRDVREPVLLQLPVGRSPPQGSILELPVLVAEPRSGEDGFDERTWLRRHGVHVVLHGRDPELVGRRGGLGGVADRLRSAIGAALASGVSGERRAVLLGIVLGEDEGLDEDLRDAFRASGLYHLLSKDQ
jgi:competence protein ComEC